MALRQTRRVRASRLVATVLTAGLLLGVTPATALAGRPGAPAPASQAGGGGPGP